MSSLSRREKQVSSRKRRGLPSQLQITNAQLASKFDALPLVPSSQSSMASKRTAKDIGSSTRTQQGPSKLEVVQNMFSFNHKKTDSTRILSDCKSFRV
jgi:hypothetical protein